MNTEQQILLLEKLTGKKVLLEDFLVVKGKRVKEFLDKIKSDIHNYYELKGDTLKFLISGDEETIKRYKDIAKEFDITDVKFEV